MTPTTRGSLMVKRRETQVRSLPCPFRAGSSVGRAQRDEGFEVPPTMGRHIQKYKTGVSWQTHNSCETFGGSGRLRKSFVPA